MTVYVDADACPVVRIVEKVSKEFGVSVCLLCDTNHVLTSDCSEVVIVGAGADAVDIALINRCKAGDIVVTQDYGVAALALGKKALAIHQSRGAVNRFRRRLLSSLTDKTRITKTALRKASALLNLFVK